MYCRSSKSTAWHLAWLCTVVVHLGSAAEIVSRNPAIPSVCMNGAYDEAGECVCNPGFSKYKGNCFLTTVTSTCPPGSIMWQGFCRPQATPPVQDVIPAKETFIVVPPLRVPLPTPPLTDPLDPTLTEEDDPEDEDDDDGEGELNMPPTKDHHLNISFRKIVNNYNVINNATMHNTRNINNVIVHFTRKKHNGAVRTVVIRNNETSVYDEEASDSPPSNTTISTGDDDGKCDEQEQSNDDATITTEATPAKDLPCCKIVSPRVCRKQEDEWVCFHRKQYVCSKVCTAEVMYLRPRRPHYRHPWLVMPPMQNYSANFNPCRWGQCLRTDCSGCLQGRVRCHPMCYTYDCQKDNSCHFIDHELICKGRSSKICSLLLLDEKTIDLTRTNKTAPAKQ
uniref:Uncharacterized protein n=1 Tax=Anopheles dirus TaxID=7168 RepID=A0A182NRJ1_9DIPT